MGINSHLNKVRLNISKISPGMKLAEPITNPAGITLMPAGIRLTPMFIARIKKWNVQELDVFVEKPRDTSLRTSKPAAPKPTEVKPAAPQGGKPPAPAVEQENTLTAEEEEFARATTVEISRPFINVKNNPIMMQLRAVVIRRLVMHGRDGAVNVLRRGPQQPEEQETT